MPSATDFYEHNIQKIKILLSKNRNQRRAVSFARILAFALLITGVYFFIKQGEQAFAIVSIVSILLFFWLVNFAVRLSNKNLFYKALLKINQNEIDLLNNKPNQFANGQEFLHFDSFLSDLDVFGNNSLFHLLNRTATTHGKSKLASLLASPGLDETQILETQIALKALQDQQTGVQETIAIGLQSGESEGTLNELSGWLESPNLITEKRWPTLIRFILPPFTIAAFLYYLSTDQYGWFIIMIALSWIVTGIFTKYILAQHLILGRKQNILDQYAGILKYFQQLDPKQSAELNRLNKVSANASTEIYRLSRLSKLFDQRMNLLVNIFLNSFLLYDLHIAIGLEKWKKRNRDYYHQWIEAVGEIESILSLSIFAYNHPGNNFPSISDHQTLLVTTDLGHPLIPADELITNSFSSSGEKLILITGSNMSGKTTFLRAIGVNFLLAQAGAPVCAKQFAFKPVQILTSIRINDSLQEHTSYFMAELKRLQQIKNKLDNGIPALILIDEILRGTNSDDKTFGSAGFIKKLLPYRCLAFFATHDLALSSLENEHPGFISNACFESEITADTLSFDYKLRKGVAQNKNASFLMKKMNII